MTTAFFVLRTPERYYSGDRFTYAERCQAAALEEGLRVTHFL
jgi:hypothetical protein